MVESQVNGALNLNRYLSMSVQEVVPTRPFEMLSSDDALELAFGFSDELTLEPDRHVTFAGKNTFVRLGSREEPCCAEGGGIRSPSLCPGACPA